MTADGFGKADAEFAMVIKLLRYFVIQLLACTEDGEFARFAFGFLGCFQGVKRRTDRIIRFEMFLPYPRSDLRW